MRRLPLSLAAMTALVALPGCDFGTDAVGLTGTWKGQVFDASNASTPRYDITLRLVDDGQTVSGTGTVGSADGEQRFAVTNGSFVGTAVTLPLTFASDPIPGSLAGTLTNRDPGRIEGSFSGPSDLDGNVRIEIVAR